MNYPKRGKSLLLNRNLKISNWVSNILIVPISKIIILNNVKQQGLIG